MSISIMSSSPVSNSAALPGVAVPASTTPALAEAPVITSVAPPVDNIPEIQGIKMVLSKEPRLEGKVAVVTGAGNGLGQATALLYAKHGAKVVVVDLDEAKAQETVKHIQAMGGTAIAVKADVANYEQCESAITEAAKLANGEPIDILAHFAGITNDKGILNMAPSDWQRVIDVNLTGTFNMAKAASHKMAVGISGKEKKSGIKHRSIILASSISGLGGAVGQTNYSASKAGVNGFMMALSKELASRNVCVNSIAPGFVEGTGMTVADANGVEKIWFQIARYLHGCVGLKRPMCQAKDIANTALYLASDDSSHVTGQVHVADAGLREYSSTPTVYQNFTPATAA